MDITIPIRTSNPLNGAQGRHWAVARKRKAERLAVALFLNRHTPPPLPVVVTLVRIAPRRLDDDGLRAALKSCRDQVAIWLGLPCNVKGHAEDSDPRVCFKYSQGKGKPREYAVVVRSEHVPQAIVDAARGEEEWTG